MSVFIKSNPLYLKKRKEPPIPSSVPTAGVEQHYRGGTRNFFMYSVLKSMPLYSQYLIYDEGNYFTTGDKASFSSSFMDSYSVLCSLKEITDITDDDQNNYIFLDNESTHEIMLLKVPEYEPGVTNVLTSYDSDKYVFNFDIKDLEKVLPENSDIIKVSELFYLGLLLEDQPEMINYSFSKEYIILINNKLNNCPIKNSLQNVFVSKMIITLIKYFYQQTEEEKIIQLEVIKKENIELIEIILGKNDVLKQLKYTIDEVLNKNTEEIYLDIIQLLIKNTIISNYQLFIFIKIKK